MRNRPIAAFLLAVTGLLPLVLVACLLVGQGLDRPVSIVDYFVIATFGLSIALAVVEEFTDLRKSRKSRILISSKSLIAGRSGSGKSTLLNIIGALETVDSGELLVCGSNIKTWDADRRADFRLYHVGFVFQAYNLIRVLCARENVPMCVSCKGGSASIAWSRRNIGWSRWVSVIWATGGRISSPAVNNNG